MIQPRGAPEERCQERSRPYRNTHVRKSPHATIVAMSRLESLKNLVAQDPDNSFMRYGLAMEYANAGKYDLAMKEFETVLEKNSKYAAAYYHGGQTLERMGKADEARELYKKGISVTTDTGDLHTRSELQAALDILG